MNSVSFEDKDPRLTRLKPVLALSLLCEGLFYIRAVHFGKMAKPFGFLESSYTVVFPMFNQCIRFGEGGVRPTHSIQAIARTKSLS